MMAPADYERKAKQMKNDGGPNEGARVERAVEGKRTLFSVFGRAGFHSQSHAGRGFLKDAYSA